MKLFCNIPLRRISIDNDGNIWPACCPDWVEFPYGNIMNNDINEIFNSENAQKFKHSVIDGSLRHCDWNWCPHISDAKSGIKNEHVKSYDFKKKYNYEFDIQHVNLNYDLTCNLKCPSCRTELIHIKGKEFDRVYQLHQKIETIILPHVESFALTGVGDPFMSKIFRKFLFEIDVKKYPRLKKIHFHTNGQLFNENLYHKMKGIHHLNISMDISIDAATSNTYSKVRPPGSWETLLENLNFIKSLENIKDLGISMVVQKDNYKEMHDFIDFATQLSNTKKNVFVEFKRLRHWGNIIPLENYKKMGLEFLSAAQKIDFLEILESIENRRLYHDKMNLKPIIKHNLQEFLNVN